MTLKVLDEVFGIKHAGGTVHVASFPGPAQLSVTCSMEKRERALYNLSCE